MDEFEQLAKEMESVYQRICMIKDKYHLSGVTIECYSHFDQFCVKRGSRTGYIGERRFRNHRRAQGTRFERIK